MTEKKLTDAPQSWSHPQDIAEAANRARAEAIGNALAAAINWISNATAKVWQHAETWRANQKAMSELAQCSDWMLQDIGIRRGQIREAVHGAASRHDVPVANPTIVTAPQGQPVNDQTGAKGLKVA